MADLGDGMTWALWFKSLDILVQVSMIAGVTAVLIVAIKSFRR